ncbi:MAG: PQQ-binding-like beta-propeller repeat protein [Candidatus Zixiibacteriota bacterium]|nr:MAG: PQQ-binding-like beta-propeller repeat protein [candidate division Zixibacteria bacterium]
MRPRLSLYILTIACLIPGGCTKKFRLPADEQTPPPRWTYSRQDVRSTARIGSDFGGELNLKWEDKISESPVSPLSIGAGRLIFCGTKRRIYFYDIKSGDFKGRVNTKGNVQTGVVVIDSVAYFGTSPKTDEFFCLNLHNRKVLWSRPLKDVTGGPIIIDDRLFVGSSAGELYCLNRLSGEIIWQRSAKAKSLAGPSGGGGIVYFPLDNGNLMALKAATGEMVFEAKLDQPLAAKTVLGDNVYVTGIEGGLFAVDRQSGETAWSKEFAYPVWTSPALDDGVLFFGDNGGLVRALNTDDGSVLWEFQSEGVVVSSPIIVGDFVIFGSLDRFLYCCDKKTGTLVSSREFKRGISIAPVSDGQVICVASQDGTIQCFGD